MNRFREIFSKENLTSKLAGLPVWAWGLILGLVAVFVYYMFLRKKDNTSVSSDDITKQTDSNTSDVDSLSSGLDDLYAGLAALPTSDPNNKDTEKPAVSSTPSSGGGGGYSYYQPPAAPSPANPKSINDIPLNTPASIGGYPPRRTSGGSFGYPETITQKPKNNDIWNPFQGLVDAANGMLGLGIDTAVNVNKGINNFFNPPKPPQPVQTKPADPIYQTHIPLVGSAPVADISYASGTPSKQVPATAASKAKPTPKAVTTPSQVKVTKSPGQKVAF